MDTEKGSGLRLTVGTRPVARGQLHLALMSSENWRPMPRRTIPAGWRCSCSAWNASARLLQG